MCMPKYLPQVSHCIIRVNCVFPTGVTPFLWTDLGLGIKPVWDQCVPNMRQSITPLDRISHQ